MNIYAKTARLANKFEAAYPAELPGQMRWWCKALGIGQERLLGLMGMPARQVARYKTTDFGEILKNPKWEENARAVEEGLHRLLGLFHYDWQALADRIHQPVAEPGAQKDVDVGGRKGQVQRRRYAANGAPFNCMSKGIGAGGPESLAALFGYLLQSQTDQDTLCDAP